MSPEEKGLGWAIFPETPLMRQVYRERQLSFKFDHFLEVVFAGGLL